jgi:endonuclease/exonuclease/phosphatase family metal-dependent hydrolase
MRRVLGVALAVAVVTLAACSDDGGGDSSDETTDESTDAAPARDEPTDEIERTGAITDVPPVSTDSVRAVTLNQLHGLTCTVATDACNAPVRVELLYDQLEAAGCPELVGLQEIGARQGAIIPNTLDQVCGGEYELAWEGEDSQDRNLILTRLPIIDQDYLDLAAFPWSAYWVQVESPALGPVDFLTTHFASSTNDPDCTPEICPPVCPAGIRANQCNALEVVDFLAQTSPATVTIVGGDLNAVPGEPTIQTFLDAAYLDAWLAAGNPECDAATGVGCTGGPTGEDTDLDGLDNPDRIMTERIDYLLVRPGPDCTPSLEVVGFADQALAEPVSDLFWVSDHTGLLGTVRCTG